VKTPHLLVAMSVFVVGVFGYAVLAPTSHGNSANAESPAARASSAAVASAAAPAPSVAAVYDPKPLIKPAGKYLGVAIAGAPQDMSRLDAWTKNTGTTPNMVTIYESFDDDYAASEARKIYQYGALPIIRWEPFKDKLTDIASGRFDDYLTDFATSVKTTNVPIALTVAHEMNGAWYPWGTQKNKPADFVAAWRHVHDVFAKVGATNVIWTWTPNVVNYLRNAPLKTFWPGAAYVDWLGIDGYFTHKGAKTFDGLFGQTLTELKKISSKPVLIVETGSEPGSMRPAAIRDLLTTISSSRSVIGFVYFNEVGSANWKIDSDKPAQTVLRTRASKDGFGFEVP
jgi:hypothetical protein